jgi:hypothetical protein
MNIEQIRIISWARGWNDAAMGRPMKAGAEMGYVLGYLDARR